MLPRAPSSGTSLLGGAPWRWALGGIISLLCALLLLSRVESSRLVRELSGVDPGRMVIAILAGLCLFLARAWRWRLIFPSTLRPSYRDCVAALACNNLVNNLVPARGGDLLRCLLVKRAGAAGASVALGTLVVEKILDGLSFVLVLVLAVVLLGPPGWVMIAASIPGAVFAGALIFVVALRLRSSWVLSLATRLLGRCRSRYLRERGVGLISRFIDGLAVIGSRWQTLAVVGLTASIWLGESMVTCWIAHAMGARLSLIAASVVCAMIGLGYMVPAGPAAVGSYEAAAVAGLGLFEIHGERALAVALVLHACSLVLTTGLGLVGLVLAAGTRADPVFPDGSRSHSPGSAPSTGDGDLDADGSPMAPDEGAAASAPDEAASHLNRSS